MSIVVSLDIKLGGALRPLPSWTLRASSASAWESRGWRFPDWGSTLALPRSPASSFTPLCFLGGNTWLALLRSQWAPFLLDLPGPRPRQRGLAEKALGKRLESQPGEELSLCPAVLGRGGREQLCHSVWNYYKVHGKIP